MKLSKLGERFSKWARDEKRGRDRQTKDLNSRMLELCDADISEVVLAEMTDIKLQMNLEADMEELFWEQRARVNWLHMGDRNTTFFHRWASFRRKKNRIKGLMDENGCWVSEPEGISKVATDYFKELFTVQGTSSGGRLDSLIMRCIPREINDRLVRDFEAAEVLEAVKSIAPLKASGKDGYPAIFFQKYLHIVGEEMTKYCLQVLNGQRNMEEVNYTNIVLILKVNSPKSMKEFHPISLCNVVYKIISKVIVNRFRLVLHYCIDDSQGAFVPGRQITDNIIVAYEILHSMKKRRGGLNKSFALKLDMSKAYDRVE
ncbi:hypothetical protein J1N35_009719 [Gossypium stocksii]|uniref:Reverse transcriptase domain-containing protein n=1 Tax=Gossypium stocksii TaxID=47602 RepID=A0A9D3VYG4_9ROSI|nr:hypothetical protein J1N35_009719 [Gossypium stocksii]